MSERDEDSAEGWTAKSGRCAARKLSMQLSKVTGSGIQAKSEKEMEKARKVGKAAK